MISIVIPAHNESKRIKKTIKKIIEYFDDCEIIVINDGSTDNTKSKIEELDFKNLKLIDYEKNKGKGYAVKQGVLKACEDLILISDADLSTPIEEYSKLKYWIDKGYDIAIASRRMENSNIRTRQPLHRRFSGWMFGITAQLLAVPGIKDTQCGFKLFRKKSAKKLFEMQKIDGFAFDVEILFLARKHKYKIKEVPVTWVDSAKHSKVNVIRDSVRMFIQILKIRLMH